MPKNITIEQSGEERGRVTGTPVGCAVDQSVDDWRSVSKGREDAGFGGVVSIEYGSFDEAWSSYVFLSNLADE